jgi:hypothetical protein
VAWGCEEFNRGQCAIPGPNIGFIAIAAGGFQSLAIRRMPGDANGDGDVDLADFVSVTDSLLGPFDNPTQSGWQFFDVDSDSDIDLRDLASWQHRFTCN